MRAEHCVPCVEREEGLRRRQRLELHRTEQRRLALATLRADRRPPGADDASPKHVLGLDGLRAQLDDAAPSPFLAGGEPTSGELAPGAAPTPAGGAARRLGRAASTSATGRSARSG